MASNWSARVFCTSLTIVFMTQPGFAAAGHVASKSVRATVEASRRRLEAVMHRGEEVDAGVRLKYEDRLAALAAQIDVEANANAPALAGRLGTEFKVPAEQVTAEHELCGGSWGDLLMARLLQANASFGITTAQVFMLHKNGMAWTMVAHGLGLDVDDFAQATEHETHVALGDVKPGKLQTIAAGSGTSASN